MTHSLQPRVVLISMPWAPVSEPSLALGILHAHLKKAGIFSRVLHANTALLRYITFETWMLVVERWGLNEFVFTETLSPGVDETQLQTMVELCQEFLSGSGRIESPYPTVESMVEMLLRFRDEVVPSYLEDCAEEILASKPTMVGLTCLFDQTMASVSLAKIIKEKSPDTLIVLGGYALEGPPGEQILKSFPWIDCIAIGDGEMIIEKLANASVGTGRLNEIAGILLRESVRIPAQKIDMNTSAEPDYEHWFTDIAALDQNCKIKIVSDTLPIESSRGCWWGQQKHCVFCGIDEETLKFRQKSSDHVIEMLASLRKKYGNYQFRFSDYILPKPYFDELLPRLAEVTPKYHLECEIKANQTPERMRSLADAGFREVQPGIESFSSRVLRLMDKGVSGIQNVALLKYGYREGIVIHYNFLYGLPDEDASEYKQMLIDIPKLYHLFPPVSRTEAIVTRFAPLHENPQRFGVNVKPRHHRCYDTLFSQETLRNLGFSLDDYAYYFERYLEYKPEMETLYHQVLLQINHWKKRHQDNQVYLGYELYDDSLCFHDSRFGGTRDIVLSKLESTVYLACDFAPTVQVKLIDEVALGQNCSVEEVTRAISRLDEERLIWREGKHVFGLGVPWNIVSRHLESHWTDTWIGIYL